MLTLNTRSVEKEEDDATRAPESGINNRSAINSYSAVIPVAE